MRVRCESFDDFVENLVHTKVVGQTLFEDCVRVSINSDQTNEASAVVFFHASAIIQSETHEYLLQYDEQCGIDYFDQEDAGMREGSARASFLKQNIKDLDMGHVLPGVLEE